MSQRPAVSSRVRVTREPQLAIYDRQTVYKILDEGFICHLGFACDGQSFVIPTSYGRKDNLLFVHGSAASRMLRHASTGLPVCLAVTLLDGIVLARSLFNHSMNYRSVIVLGNATAIEDRELKLAALHIISEHILPGRWNEARTPNERELKATTVMSLPVEEFSAKVRTGPPTDDEEDYAFPAWAGVIPLNLVPGVAIRDERVPHDIHEPEYVRHYLRRN